MVTCDVPAAAEAPTCERAAAVYFGAMGGMVDENVGVRVLREGSSVPACSRLYAPNGADLGYRASLIDAKQLQVVVDRVFPFAEAERRCPLGGRSRRTHRQSKGTQAY